LSQLEINLKSSDNLPTSGVLLAGVWLRLGLW